MSNTTSESFESFSARVLARTGVALNEIAGGTPDNLLGGHIFCARGNTFVVAVGYPSHEDEDGCPVWGAESFRVVNLDWQAVEA